MKKKIIENLKTLLYALIIALFIRSLFFQPFYIPSSSMEPALQIGDRIFVSKYTYGYSRHSFPFSPKIFNGRIFNNEPKRGDVIVFKTPADNRTDYIKRLIGIPGDKIQFIDAKLIINNNQIPRKEKSIDINIFCGEQESYVNSYEESLPNGIKYVAVYNSAGGYKNSNVFIIPDKHYFFLGDNRDCSKDSRYLTSVGYVHEDNLVGKAKLIFFSNNKKNGSFLEFWKWNKSLRIQRFFSKIE